MAALKTAFVIGATGAVGRKLVENLVESKQFSKVVLICRRNVDDFPVSDILEQKVVDFDNIEKHADEFKDLDIGFSTMGTTRAKAGAADYYKIDHDYVVNTAKVAKEQGVKSFVFVTSTGANENSYFTYPKLKGEIERDVLALGFDKTLIARPGFLDGRDVPDGEVRFAELAAKVVIKPLKFFFKGIAVNCDDVAKAMIVGSVDPDLKGKLVWENAELKEKAKLFKA